MYCGLPVSTACHAIFRTAAMHDRIAFSARLPNSTTTISHEERPAEGISTGFARLPRALSASAMHSDSAALGVSAF